MNSEIQAPNVRLVDYKGVQQGVVSRAEALRLMEEAEGQCGVRLDLVEIAPQANPPVCQMVDYSKYIFELKKKKAVQRKKQKQVKVKEIKLRPVTEKHDYEVKLKHLISFLQGNDRVKISIRFRGREMEHRDLGQELLKSLIQAIGDYGVIEMPAKLEGKQLITVVAPKKRIVNK